MGQRRSGVRVGFFVVPFPPLGIMMSEGRPTMRTTVTLDDDVAAELRKLSQGHCFTTLANRAVRLGLLAMEHGAEDPPYETEARRGRPLVRKLDNIAELLAEHEQRAWR